TGAEGGLSEVTRHSDPMQSGLGPAPVSYGGDTSAACIELIWRALAPAVPDKLPAGHYRSVCATFISGLHPANGELFVLGEPLLGGWGATSARDGVSGLFCCANGETYNIPIELAERRYGVKIERYAFSDEPGGAGCYRGGKGVVLEYRVTAERAFLTVTFSRTDTAPW